jgi:hypothetical protein
MFTIVSTCLALALLPPGRLVRAGAEVEAIGAELGQRIEISSRLANEMLYIENGAASPGERLVALAHALNASLTTQDYIETVARTAHDLKAIHAKRTSVRAAWIASRLKYAADYRLKRGGHDLNRQSLEREIDRESKAWGDVMSGRVRAPTEVMGIGNLLPCEQLLEALVFRIGERNLAAIPSGELRVYEDAVLPGSHSLPEFADLVSQYRSALRKLAVSGLSDRAAEEVKELNPNLAQLLGVFREDINPTRCRLVVDAGPVGMGIHLDIYEHTGRLMDSAYLWVFDKQPFLGGNQIADNAVGTTADTRVPLGPSELDGVRVMLGGHPTAARDWFSSPDKHEPLDLFARAAVSNLIAGSSGRCVVADVPDEFLTIAARCVTRGSLNCSGFRTLLEQCEGYERVDLGGDTVWRPTDPEYTESRRANRVSLARYTKQLMENGANIERLRAKAFHEGFPGVWEWAGSWVLSARNLSHMPNGSSGVSAKMYAVLGGISDSAWDELEAGATRTASQLGITEELLQLFDDESTSAQSDSRALSDLDKHPAELYTTLGIGDTPISLRKLTRRVVQKWTLGGNSGRGWSPIDRLPGTFPFVSEDPVSGNLTPSRGDFEAKCSARFGFRFAVEDDVDVVIGLPQGCSLSRRLSVTRRDVTQDMGYGDLPQDLRDQIWAIACDTARRTAAKERQQLTTGQGQQTGGLSRVPPP